MHAISPYAILADFLSGKMDTVDLAAEYRITEAEAERALHRALDLARAEGGNVRRLEPRKAVSATPVAVVKIMFGGDVA